MRTKLGLGAHIGALLRRPVLLVEAMRAAVAMRRRKRLTPSASYLNWRSHTAYGVATAVPVDDFIDFLAWRKTMRRLAG